MADTVETLGKEISQLRTELNLLKTEVVAFKAYAEPVIKGHQQSNLPQRQYTGIVPPFPSHDAPMDQPKQPDTRFPPPPGALPG